MKYIIYTLFLTIFISSCAFHSGMVSSDLAPEGVHYEDIAHGYSQTVHFLGMGGLDRDALILEAKRNMYKNRPLKKGERYLNIVVDLKTTYFLGRKVTCVISSDVISTDKNAESVFSENYSNILGVSEKKDDLFSVGDSVVSAAGDEFIIIGFTHKNSKALLEEIGGEQELNHVSYDFFSIYKQSGEYRGYQVGETVFSGRSSFTILALGFDRVKLVSVFNNVFYYKYDKIQKAPAE